MSQLFSKDDPSSGWKLFFIFLWQGGFRSIIVLSTVIGAIFITLFNDKVCPAFPHISQNPAGTQTQQPTSTTTPQNPAGTQTQQPTSTTTPQNPVGTQASMILQPNPTCNKYFELVFMIVGGYLGLAAPNTGAKDDSKDKQLSPAIGDLKDEQKLGSSTTENNESNQSPKSPTSENNESNQSPKSSTSENNESNQSPKSSTSENNESNQSIG